MAKWYILGYIGTLSDHLGNYQQNNSKDQLAPQLYEEPVIVNIHDSGFQIHCFIISMQKHLFIAMQMYLQKSKK